ncbi:hypothetical protein C5F47_08865 [Nitrosopumilus cobalaminigenes]|uniref:Uncharacterized protein n=1 Tax=Nitrosopumilus cobalaminigenes TaxID=1470066 RepID=A0A7D5QZQ4_9ARCH|nr:hypothetical protein [Nitrosopumilus cobalaminigenes]QLH03640.1 hypothetical protein C5F47_08865 [Nitrosopumilus cobalaminigenes]
MQRVISFEDIKKWHYEGQQLELELNENDWEYRKKICTKCTIEEQKKLHCLKVNNFKDGIQETHCDKLIHARTQKNKKKIEGYIESHPLRQGT